MEMKSTRYTSNTLHAENLVKRLMDFYEDLTVENLDKIDRLNIYAQDVEFADPIHHINGLFAVKRYLRSLCGSLLHYKVRYTDVNIGEESAYLTWEMDYAHKKLHGGKVLTLRGITQLKYTSDIHYHEDFYDLGAMIYEHVPVVGPLTRLLKKRLAD